MSINISSRDSMHFHIFIRLPDRQLGLSMDCARSLAAIFMTYTRHQAAIQLQAPNENDCGTVTTGASVAPAKYGRIEIKGI